MKKNYSLGSLFLLLESKTRFVACLTFLVLSLFAQPLRSQQTYTFTNASQTGSVGPSQAQVNTAYLSTNLSGSVVVSGGVQIFRIPISGNYGIQAFGASGGGISGGYGAVMKGEFFFNAGDSILIMPGQMGIDALDGSTTGGGGSFAVLKNASSTTTMTTGRPVTPLVIAGGGGGNPGTSNTNCNASLTGTANAGNGVDGSGVGGVNGNGGGISVPAGNNRGGGGGGFLTDGDHTGTCGTGGLESGRSFLNGGSGGLSTTCSTGYPGGFGGGGGAISSGWRSSGGGGGYSGGGGGQTNAIATTHRGGGGASYNSGINQVNSVNTSTGHGKVIISELCNIKIFASGTNSTNPSICSGNSLSLTTTAVSNYTWSNGNTTSTMIVVSPTSSQTYSIIGTSSLACQAIASISVTVSSGLPVLSITNPSNNICLGKTATLTASGALSYTWTGGVTNGVAFAPSATSSYTVTGQNGCGTSTAATGVTIAPLVVTAVANPTNICAGSSTSTLTASAAVTGFTWQPLGVPGQSIVASPTANTIYTVTASDGTCAGTATVLLTTRQTPTITAVASTSVICANATVTLTASGGTSYSWTPINLAGATVTASPTAPTQYVVVGTNSLGCSASAAAIVLTNPSPTIIPITTKTLVCVGGTAVLIASGVTSYSWVNGPSNTNYTVNPQTTTTYTVIGINAGGCIDTKTIQVSVFIPTLSVTASSSSVCIGNTVNLTASGAATFTWSGGIGNGPTITPTITASDVFTITANTVSNAAVCSSSATIGITALSLPTIGIVATKTVMCRKDANAILTAQGGTAYVWSNNATVATTLSASSANAVSTIYTVTGTDANGCVNTGTILIKVNTCTGISGLNTSETGISVYPNPSSGEFTIQSQTELNLKLLNQIGQELRFLFLSAQNEYKLSVTDLPNGVYFLVGQNGVQKINQKIIVAK